VSDHDGPVGGSPVTFEEFRRIIARELNVDEKLVVPEASFQDTLYADSIRLVELMLRLDQQGITIPMEEAWNVRTVEEAYTVYSRHAGGGKSKPAAPA
jgi:acyl carrier protein